MGCCQSTQKIKNGDASTPLLELSKSKEADSKGIQKIFEDRSNEQESKPNPNSKKENAKEQELKQENKTQQNKHVNENKNENDNLNNYDDELPEDFYVENGLIGMIGIGEYDENQNLDGISYDYKNIINTFVGKYKHKILYKLNDGSLVYSNDIKEILESKSNFKLRWSEDDILDYTMEYRKHVIKNKHDAAMFFIEGHGDQENELVLVPSVYNDDTVGISQLIGYFKPSGSIWLNDKETQTESNYLCRIPKIVFVDICRGQTRLQPIKLCNNNNSNNNNNNNNNSNDDNINFKCLESDEAKFSCDDANMCIAYGNSNGYAVIGGSKGSQFTSCVCTVFDDTASVQYSDLQEIIRKIRKKTKIVTTNTGAIQSTQIVQCEDTMERNVVFNVPDE